jgi:hypothetical protein
MMEKNILWKKMFNLHRIMTKSKQKKGEVQFAGSITRWSLCICPSFLKEGSKEETQSYEKKFWKKIRFGTNWLESNGDNNIEEEKVIGLDPGKHTILHLTNETSPKTENQSTLSYTTKQRMKEGNFHN